MKENAEATKKIGIKGYREMGGYKGNKILVVSDSHGSHMKLREIVHKEYPFDFIIHCGDGLNDLFNVNISSEIKVIRVSGNVDLSRGFEVERIVYHEINKKKIMVTHGDLFNVHNDYSLMRQEGKNNRVDVIFFGHTHIKFLSERDKPVLYNPGPLLKGCYGVVFIDESMKFIHKIIE